MKTRLSSHAQIMIALAAAVFVSLACGNVPIPTHEPTSNVTVVPGGGMQPNETLDAAWGVPTKTMGPTPTTKWSTRWDFNLCSMLEKVRYEFVIKDQFTIRDGGFYCSNELHIKNTSIDTTIAVYVLTVDDDGSDPVWVGTAPLGPGESDTFIGFAANNPAVNPPASHITLTKLVAIQETQQCKWILSEDALGQLLAAVLDQPCKLP
jgi:hypothetical protein